MVETKLRVHGAGAFEPATVRIEAVIRPEADNRAACLVVQGEEYDSLSCWDLDGENSAVIYQREFRDIPGGDYLAVLTIQGDKVKRVQTQFLIAKRGVE